jgi:predicted nucleotide-binding protein
MRDRMKMSAQDRLNEDLKDIFKELQSIKLDIQSNHNDLEKHIAVDEATDKTLIESISLIKESLIENTQTNKENTKSLIEHMSRTMANESMIENILILSDKMDKRVAKIEESDIARTAINAMLKKLALFIAAMSGLAGTAYTILNIIKYFS